MKNPNTSSAVIQQRIEPADSLDDFPTPPWGTRALFEHVIQENISECSVWEPACNRGYMIRPLQEYFGKVYATDICDYGLGNDKLDFLETDATKIKVDWVVTNPPFRLAENFILHGLKIAEKGVAVIVRSAFLEGQGRYERLFKETPPTIVAQFVERVAMVKGRYDPKISTATAYSWMVWRKNSVGDTKTVWIPPCKKQLERLDDLNI